MENLLQIGKEIKVVLALSISCPGNLKFSLSQIEFVYGIGFGGITKFEYILKNRVIGDEISLHINQDNLQQLFGHLLRYIQPVIGKSDNVDLKIKVLGIKQADKSDMVKTMLMTASRGCGCGS